MSKLFTLVMDQRAETGVYMLFMEASSMGVRFRDLPYLMLHATE